MENFGGKTTVTMRGCAERLNASVGNNGRGGVKVFGAKATLFINAERNIFQGDNF